jgi:hypothetical protein
MIVDVNNLELDILECFIFYNALALARADIYGIECDRELYEANLEKASRMLYLARFCAPINEVNFCLIRDYIEFIKYNNLYKVYSSQNCFGGSGTISSICLLTISETVTSCSDNLSINILR